MSEILKRSEVDVNLTWDLTTIFANDEAWEEEFESFKKDMVEIEKYSNNMVESVDNVYNTIKLEEELSLRVSKLYAYAHLKSDEDTTNSKYQEYTNKIMRVWSEFDTKATFINISLLELDENKLKEYFEDEKLKIYQFFIEKLLKRKKHTLSQKEEELISTLYPVLDKSSNTFSMLNNADILFEDVENEKGEKLPLNHARYNSYMESTDRVLRKNAYNSVYKTYGSLKNTFASTLEGNTNLNSSIAKLRNYSSARNAALSSNHITENVYDALVEAVNEKIGVLHRYVDFRKKVLGLDEIYMYDLSVSLSKECNLTFTIEEAKEIIFEALKPLGDEYVSLIKRAFDERWIDFAENEGKRSGAYSGGMYNTNPFILISWRGSLDNLFTLIHELGHSIHSYYTRNYQPYIYGHYSIFLAEVASITNEMLLGHYLADKYKDDKEVLFYLLNNDLNDIRGTLFRQTQFAEFENEIYKLSEQGQPLTADVLSNLYEAGVKKYYGSSMTYDDKIRYEWARVPHFYYDFYVYQYATGVSAAAAFSKKILNDGKEAVEKYINYLKSGNSDYPIEILKKAGVDMSTNEPIFACLKLFEEKLEQIEKLV